MGVIYASSDYLSNQIDVDRFIALLPDGVLDFLKLIDGYDHMDFVWGIGMLNLHFREGREMLHWKSYLFIDHFLYSSRRC